MEENKDIDLSRALDDSNLEDNSESNITKEQKQTPLYFPKTPRVIQLTIEHSGGLIKNVKQAQYVVIGFVVLIAIITFILIFGGGTEEVNKNIDPATEQEIIPGQIPGEI